MNAYLMSAGCAMRLRPVTEKIAKCLLPIGGVPILDHWLTAIIGSGQFENIYVNVHHCAEQVESWVGRFSELSRHPIQIIDEREKLLGTAGTLFWHGDSSQDFMLVYTDTYSRDFIRGLRNIAEFWKLNPDKPLAGLVTMNLPQDGSAAAIETDFMGNVLSFKEKSMTSGAVIGWAGIMFGRRDFFDQISREDFDLARNVLPRLCGRIRVISHVDAYDIGRSLDKYADADGKIFPTRSH